MPDKYYEATRYVCHNCGKEFRTPGAAQSCWNRHRLREVLEDVQNHEKLFIDDVIEAIEEMVEAGEFDDERFITDAEQE